MNTSQSIHNIIKINKPAKVITNLKLIFFRLVYFMFTFMFTSQGKCDVKANIEIIIQTSMNLYDIFCKLRNTRYGHIHNINPIKLHSVPNTIQSQHINGYNTTYIRV